MHNLKIVLSHPKFHGNPTVVKLKIITKNFIYSLYIFLNFYIRENKMLISLLTEL